MEYNEKTQEVIEYLRTIENRELKIDEVAMNSSFVKKSEVQSMSLQLLSIFGGVIGSLTFIGFLKSAGLYQSEIGMLIFGGLFIGAALLLNKLYDTTLIDAISVSVYISGLIMLVYALREFKVDKNIVNSSLIVMMCCFLGITQRYLFSFISILVIIGCILSLLISNNSFDYIHFNVLLLVALISFIHLHEAKILSGSGTSKRLYYPLRSAVVFSLLLILMLLGISKIEPTMKEYPLVSSLSIISAVIYFLPTLFQVLDVTTSRHKVILYVVSIAALLPTVYAPGISGALLIMLLSFRVNSKSGLALGIIAFVYFVSRYYYDLQFTLLTKSLLLLASGIFFLVVYFFTQKFLTSNEEV
jgi:uncharacterized membrane protein